MKKKIFALGFFDGVHRGHQALLTQCVAMAETTGCVPAAITFDRHPQALFTSQPPLLLNTNADRDALLQRFGIRQIHRLATSKEVMSTPWQNFLEDLLAEGAVGFVCGDDFRFGNKGAGDGQKLLSFCEARGLYCAIIPEQTLNGRRISSTYIRSLIETGDVETAAVFLGHPHIFSGKVVPGRQLGRTIGIPTANLQLPEGIVCPKRGVYACTAQLRDETYLAVTNVGTRPTVDGNSITVEPWLLDFSGDLYGKTITLEFHSFLRPEEKFASLEALKAQIQADAAACCNLLR